MIFVLVSASDIADNAANIASNSAAISSNDADILSISTDVANATRCTALNWDYSCCTSANPCGLNQGDCDSDDECSGDLKCGTDNCLNFGAGNNADCCIVVILENNVVWFEAYRYIFTLFSLIIFCKKVQIVLKVSC